MRLKASPKPWRSSLFLRHQPPQKVSLFELFTFCSRKQNKVPQTSSFSSKMYAQKGSFQSSKEKQLSVLVNWPGTLTLGSDLLKRGFGAPNPIRNSQDTSGYFTCLSMRGVTLPGLPCQSTVRTMGWGAKQQRVKGENEATMNNPGKAEWPSLTVHPLQTPDEHSQC